MRILDQVYNEDRTVRVAQDFTYLINLIESTVFPSFNGTGQVTFYNFVNYFFPILNVSGQYDKFQDLGRYLELKFDEADDEKKEELYLLAFIEAIASTLLEIKNCESQPKVSQQQVYIINKLLKKTENVANKYHYHFAFDNDKYELRKDSQRVEEKTVKLEF